MQLDASQQEDSEDEENEDFHILVLETNPPTNDTDVMMEDSEFESALLLDPFTEELDSAVTNIQLEGETNTAAPNQEMPQANFASSSSSDPVRLESPAALVPKLKIEENPFSPSVYSPDAEMYPPLPSPQKPGPPPAAAPLPQGPILFHGVYYMPVPAPHNVVVAQSTTPTPTKVPCVTEVQPIGNTGANAVTEVQPIRNTGANAESSKDIPQHVQVPQVSQVPLTEETQPPEESLLGSPATTPNAESKAGPELSAVTTPDSETKTGSKFAIPSAPHFQKGS